MDISEGRDVSEVLRSYRKNREGFWSQLHLAHLKDQCGTTFLILGIYHEVGWQDDDDDDDDDDECDNDDDDGDHGVDDDDDDGDNDDDGEYEYDDDDDDNDDDEDGDDGVVVDS